MKKTLQELTTELQTLCHEGHSNDEVVLRVLDGYYKVGSVDKVTLITKDKNPDRVMFAIEAATA